MIFDNPSNRKLVFHRSHGITFNTFCAYFFDFISSVIFDMIFSTFEAILVSILRKKTRKNNSWKSLVFWLRKKSHRNCFLHFWMLFGIISGSLLVDFKVPFFIVFYGEGREAFRHQLVPFWNYFGVIFTFVCRFVFRCFRFLAPETSKIESAVRFYAGLVVGELRGMILKVFYAKLRDGVAPQTSLAPTIIVQ